MNIVRELRKKKGIQQKELAIAIGVSCPTVSAWESNKKDPSGDRLKKLANYFGVDELVILGKNVVDINNPNVFVPENPAVCGKSETEQIVDSYPECHRFESYLSHSKNPRKYKLPRIFLFRFCQPKKQKSDYKNKINVVRW